MISKRFEHIDFNDIQSLVNNKMPEGKMLEYKLELKISSDSEKKEFLYDVSSFANSSGGDIIFGIKDNGKGEPVSVVNLNLENGDAIILQIEELIRTGVNPRIPNIKIKLISDQEDTILLLRIPKSYLAPHQVTIRGTDKFYSRGTNGKFKLDVNELRDLFLENALAEKNVKDFIQERLSNIISNEEILPIATDSKIVLHLIPVEGIINGKKVDLTKVRKNPTVLRPYGGGGWENRNTFDGYISYTPSRIDVGTNESYSQIFRTGIIESVSALRFKTFDERVYIPSHDFTTHLMDTLNSHGAQLRFVPT